MAEAAAPAQAGNGKPAGAGAQPDIETRLRSPGYVRLLLLAAVIGAPISAAAYFFLQFVNALQRWTYVDLPAALGLGATPLWWPLPLLFVAGVVVGVTVRHLPGRGGHSPADGFGHGGDPAPVELPGVLLAALATLGLGAVLGPEAPLIALGAGLAVCAVRLARRDVPHQVGAVVAATGSFAAVSALLGSPLLGAFLLMEASALGGPALGLVLLPGLLAAGIGDLVFLGLGTLTGLGPVTLALPGLPPFDHPDPAQFGWAVVIGVAAALFGAAVRRLALVVRAPVERHLVVLTPVVGLTVAALAIAYAAGTGGRLSDVLFSGQAELPHLLQNGADFSVAALLLLLACKGSAYGLSMAAFRGGPIFPAMYLGAAGGLALSHLPGLPVVAGVAMGIGAMSVAMLRLPLTSVLLATLLLGADGLTVMPLVIVTVVVAHVVAAWLTPVTSPEPAEPGVPVRGDAAAAAPRARPDGG